MRAIQAALEQKAHDVIGLHVGPHTYVADYYVIASGTSDRHVRGIADRVRKELKEVGEQPLSVVGMENGEWVLLDYGDVVVHVFFEAARTFYNLDEMWQRAKPLSLPSNLESQAKKLRTGMY
ncbi:MAG: ribosome silencing factor [Bdellovibrionales bacterium]|nr:ribosome silencing factor [Bdellovibrionales bacterium]